ncbi:histidine phosphatase superfamily branch 1 protein [Nitzschia inconspicua]|uniref:Histidine phosphatase superfamily branch 1 protein n=1 Tax=Nitzschia inconspicua TaxID=303405 RepID=A0A9K3KXX5_9STRA|nr:histidine phosphatase superfamily branch 1 protein [Nitzschia inconspicua]
MVDSSSSQSVSSVTSSLAGVGLFLLTTALSQWIQSNKRSASDDDDDESTRHQEYSSPSPFDEETDFRLLYQSRRLADRMSYENLPQALSIHPTLSQENSQQQQRDAKLVQSQGPFLSDVDKHSPTPQGKIMTEWNVLQQQRKSAAAAMQQRQKASIANVSKDKQEWTLLTRKFSEMEAHPNALYDFHPKNRNWRHFEHYNEHDRRRREEKLLREQSKKLNNGAGEVKSTSRNNEKLLELNNIPQPDHMMPLNDTAAVHKTLSKSEERKPHFHYRRSASSDISGATAISDTTTSDDDDDVDDARSISSSSDSEEEHFVWTKHRRNSTSSRLSQLSQTLVQPKEWNTSNGVSATDTKDASAATTPQVAPSNKRNSIPSRPMQIARRFLSLDEGQKLATEKDTATRVGKTVNPLLRSSSLEFYSRRIRAEYNARIMPEKLVLIRHGQSMGNINEVLYSTTPDNAMPLTRLGWEQARNAGAILKDKILTSGESVHFIVSPYVRTVETFHGIVSAWCDPSTPEFASIANHDEKVKAWYGRLIQLGLTWNEDSRLREQDFGNYQNPEVIKKAKEERHRFGAFYYRFPHGESASDVFDRVSTFLDSLWRSFEMNKSRNYVLITHGIVLRVLLARYFRYTIDQFNTLANPRNCEMVILGHSGDGKLDLEGRCDLDVEKDLEGDDPHVTGYKFHKRLRILPKSAIRKVKIRISPDDD